MLNSAIAFGISTDGLKSGPRDSYESLTAHWVQESNTKFELKSSVLGTIPIDERHTGENLKELLDEHLEKWDLVEKSKFYVTDNAPNISKCIKLTGDEGFGCFAHTLDLCMQYRLAVSAIGRVVNISKSAVQFVHKSTVARENLKKYCFQLKYGVIVVVTDVITRWNCILYMLTRLVLIKLPLVLTLNHCKKGNQYIPSTADFEL